MKYWKECVESALEEAGMTATDEQVSIFAKVIEGGYENYGMSHGYDAIPNQVEYRAQQELKKLKDDIERNRRWEASTRPCEECITTGVVKDVWGRYMKCPHCDGTGRYK